MKELEVKILNINLDEMEEKIISLGGTLISKELQVNTLIDSEEKPIKSFLNGYLRIRETKDILNNKFQQTLTLKKNISKEGIRENIELNVDIDNKDIMLNMLKDLGYNVVQEGFKDRVTYELKGARLDLDTWDPDTYPYPYMEIEVEDLSQLEDIIHLLGISKDNISTKSIMDLRRDLNME